MQTIPIATLQATEQPLFNAKGTHHFQQHGNAVFHADAVHHSAEDRATAARVEVFNNSSPTRGEGAVVVVNISREPFRMSLDLTPESAELLIKSLQAAVQCAREVDAVWAVRGGAA